jgi:hypothetical protein
VLETQAQKIAMLTRELDTLRKLPIAAEFRPKETDKMRPDAHICGGRLSH